MRAATLTTILLLAGCDGLVLGPRPRTETPAAPLPPPTPQPPEELPAFAPAPALMHRLTQSQVRHTLADVLGVQLTTPLPPDAASMTFASLGAARVATTEQDVEAYQAMAHEAVEAFAARADSALATCQPDAVTDACVDELLRTTGRRLFRRAVSDAELDTWRAVVTAGGQDAAALDVGLRFALEAMLQSPNFLYQAWDARPVAGQPFPRLTGESLASRLAFFLWDASPDDALLDAAAAGALDTDDGLAAAVDRMLDDPRAESLPRRFFGEAWGVAALNLDARSTTLYPEWSDPLLAAMRAELSALVDEASTGDADVRSLFDAQHGYGDDTLASLYGVSGVTGVGPFPWDSGRRGVLSSAALLVASNTHTESSAPILRGLFVLERLLCRSMPTPPAGLLDSVLAEEVHKPARSNRTRVEERRANPTCWGCHQAMDPVGLAFEGFDGVGRARTVEAGGYPVDSAGEFEGTPVASVPALSALLRDDTRVTRCMTQQLLSSATGHVLRASEARAVEAAFSRFQSSGFRFRALVTGIATSDAFRLLPAP